MVRRDRGQLILVGAVAIALVLLGLVLVVNTALFTQVVGSEGTVETAKDGGISGHELGESIAVITETENRQNNSQFLIDIAVFNEVEDTLRPVAQQRSVESGGAFLNVSSGLDRVNGSVITQTDNSTFTSGNLDLETWQPVSPTQPADVGGFNITLDVSGSNIGETFQLWVHGTNGTASGINRSLSITPTGSDTVDISVSGGATCNNIQATANTVRIDVSHGRVFEDRDCEFDLFAGIEPGYVVTFTNGDAIFGTYEFATDVYPGSLPPVYGSTADQPVASNAVWSMYYTFTYSTSIATVETERTVVEVYD